MEVRKFEASDKPGLVSLWAKVFPDDPPHNEPSSVVDAKLKIDDLILVAHDRGEIVGACIAGYDGHRGWLYAVAVDPAHRRKGIGQLIIGHALQSLEDLGCVKVNLQIRSTNTEVAAFYKSLGFAVEDRVSMGKFIN